MRSKEEVKAKFDDLRRRRLSQRRAEYLNREPKNCLHNVKLRIKGDGRCRFCRNPEILKRTNGAPFVCDEEDRARRCKLYECLNTPQTVEEDFEKDLRNPARCGEVYPKLAIMIWFLQDETRRNRLQRLRTALGEVVRSISAILFWRWW